MESENVVAAQEQAVPKAADDTGTDFPVSVVYVPDELKADIRAALENMIVEYGFEYTSVSDDMTDSISFVVTEDIIDFLSELTADLPLEDGITEGQIEFVFSNQ